MFALKIWGRQPPAYTVSCDTLYVLVQSQEKFDFPSGIGLLGPFKKTRVLTIILYPGYQATLNEIIKTTGDFGVQVLQLCWPLQCGYLVSSF